MLAKRMKQAGGHEHLLLWMADSLTHMPAIIARFFPIEIAIYFVA